MKWIPRSVAVVAMCLTVLPACKRSAVERASGDLEEAGFQLTAGDWFRAVKGNEMEVMRKFASAGFPLDQRTEEGDTALHVAAAAGAIEAADFLLDHRQPVDIRGADERTPLMAAVLADQPRMVAWLLRQGADPLLKDKDGYRALLLAAREGKARCIAELAGADRGDLDSALLLAAMQGHTQAIDALTNYGASVYSRMEDGRTPLMLAAENGHAEAAKLLVDIGSSRYTTDGDGRSVAEIATAAGHPEIAEIVSRDPAPAELSLETPEEIAGAMTSFVDQAEPEQGAAAVRRGNAVPIQDAVLSQPVEEPASGGKAAASFAMPPLAMRHYRERETPVRVESVTGDTAVMRVSGRTGHEVRARTGERIAGTNLVVVRVRRRMEDSKVNPGGHNEISVVEVKDRTSGVSREWIAGFPAEAHDPVALVEDTATGRRYTATPGQTFRAADGSEFRVTEVRPNQLVISETATGEVRTIPLRGPRG